MIFEDLIREALNPPKQDGVAVRPHVRKKPVNPLRERVLEDLRAFRAARSIPTAPEADGCSRVAS